MRWTDNNELISGKEVRFIVTEKSHLIYYCSCCNFPLDWPQKQEDMKQYFPVDQGKIYSLIKYSPLPMGRLQFSSAPEFRLFLSFLPVTHYHFLKILKSLMWPSLTPTARSFLIDLWAPGSLVVVGGYYILLTRQNSVALYAFAKVMNMMNHMGLWDTKFAWFSLRATHYICLSGLEFMVLRLQDFAWSSKFLQAMQKFLKPPGYSTMINCAFTFCTIDVFGCFLSIMAQF